MKHSDQSPSMKDVQFTQLGFPYWAQSFCSPWSTSSSWTMESLLLIV